MNGWTPTIPLKTRLENLMAQVPQEYRNRAAAECAQDNPYDFERYLKSYVIRRVWETYPAPADEAYRLESSQSAVNDPRSEWERDWDDFAAETLATRASDRP